MCISQDKLKSSVRQLPDPVLGIATISVRSQEHFKLPPSGCSFRSLQMLVCQACVQYAPPGPLRWQPDQTGPHLELQSQFLVLRQSTPW